jgi:hypothetical protein
MGLLNRPSKKVAMRCIGLLLVQMFFAGGIMVAPKSAEAQITTPSLATGVELPPSEAPCIPFAVGTGTGTSELVVRSSGPGYISSLYLSTGPATAFVVLKDTTTLGTTNANSLGSMQWTAVTSSAQVFQFAPPIRFSNGLTIQYLGQAQTNAAVVCTRLYGTSTP